MGTVGSSREEADMDFKSTLSIAGQGLSVQRSRLNIIGSNLANANTTRTEEGGPYRRREALVKSVELRDPFGSLLDGVLNEQPEGVEVERVVATQAQPRLVYDPDHPDANADGYVALPNVNVVDEMVDMLTATRAYEANTALVQSVKTMAREALSIGTGS